MGHAQHAALLLRVACPADKSTSAAIISRAEGGTERLLWLRSVHHAAPPLATRYPAASSSEGSSLPSTR